MYLFSFLKNITMSYETPNSKHLPSPKRLPAARGFGRRGFAQAGQ
jgi:hypothetical protein